jgi:Zinc knuckle
VRDTAVGAAVSAKQDSTAANESCKDRNSAGTPAGGGSKPSTDAGTAGGPAGERKQEPAGQAGGKPVRIAGLQGCSKSESGTPEGNAGVMPSGKTGFNNATKAKGGFRGNKRRTRFRSKGVVCYTCGESGHISIICPDSKEKVRCYACGKHGHISYECPAAERRSRNGKDAYCPERVMGRAINASNVGKWVAHNMSQGRSLLFDSMTGTCKILRGSEVVGGAHLKDGLWMMKAQERECTKVCVLPRRRTGKTKEEPRDSSRG